MRRTRSGSSSTSGAPGTSAERGTADRQQDRVRDAQELGRDEQQDHRRQDECQGNFEVHGV